MKHEKPKEIRKEEVAVSKEKLSVVVVDDEPIIRMDLVLLLEKAGHNVVGEGADGFEAIELCQREKPNVVLLDIRMEGLDGLSAAQVISEECPETAIILLTAFNKGEYLHKAKGCRISSYLVKPIDEYSLTINIELAVARNKELLKSRKEIHKAQEKLELRKIIEKANGVLMQEKSMSEDEAYNYIRQISKNRNMSMAKISELILRQYGE